MKRDSLHAFERLAARARDEAAPPADAADRVMAALRRANAPAPGPAYGFALGGAVLAACAAVVLYQLEVADLTPLAFALPFTGAPL